MFRVVFLCTENSNRSQMAEGFARHHGSDVLEAHSAGSKASGRVNPRAIEAMAEKGIDLGAHDSKSTDRLPGGKFDVVITMGCGDQCPWVAGELREDWGLSDPGPMSYEGLLQVRDEIEGKVLDLLSRLRDKTP
ncbi:MAG: arsenate reductase ArsC [Thermoanaerobaculia bacterium]|nr:arsenate reductase ArsC [Thermoanaerobaculia bacterium]